MLSVIPIIWERVIRKMEKKTGHGYQAMRRIEKRNEMVFHDYKSTDFRSYLLTSDAADIKPDTASFLFPINKQTRCYRPRKPMRGSLGTGRPGSSM